MKCNACGTEIPDDASYCTLCGIHVETGARADGDAPDSAVYPLLAAANLFRMRGHWDAAEQKCIEVLRLYPNNATAHSLLGDVYANQGRWEEALQWYQLAIDLDPDNLADRSKLEQTRQRMAGAADVPARGAKQAGPAAPRPERRVSPLAQLVLFALFTALLILVVLAAWPRPRPRALRPSEGMGVALPGDSGFGVSPTPGPVLPAPPAAGTPAPVRPAAPPESTGSGETKGAATETPGMQVPGRDKTEPEALAEARLRARVPVVSQPGQAAITDVRWDPLEQRALVTVVFTQSLGRDALRDEVLRGSYRVGQGLGQIGIDRFVTMVKAPVGSARAPVLVFAARADNASTWTRDATSAQSAALLTSFAGVWWHQQLR